MTVPTAGPSRPSARRGQQIWPQHGQNCLPRLASCGGSQLDLAYGSITCMDGVWFIFKKILDRLCNPTVLINLGLGNFSCPRVTSLLPNEASRFGGGVTRTTNRSRPELRPWLADSVSGLSDLAYSSITCVGQPGPARRSDLTTSGLVRPASGEIWTYGDRIWWEMVFSGLRWR